MTFSKFDFPLIITTETPSKLKDDFSFSSSSSLIFLSEYLLQFTCLIAIKSNKSSLEGLLVTAGFSFTVIAPFSSSG